MGAREDGHEFELISPMEMTGVYAKVWRRFTPSADYTQRKDEVFPAEAQ